MSCQVSCQLRRARAARSIVASVDVTQRSNTMLPGHVIVTSYPFGVGSAASPMSWPWSRCSRMKTSTSSVTHGPSVGSWEPRRISTLTCAGQVMSRSVPDCPRRCTFRAAANARSRSSWTRTSSRWTLTPREAAAADTPWVPLWFLPHDLTSGVSASPQPRRYARWCPGRRAC